MSQYPLDVPGAIRWDIPTEPISQDAAPANADATPPASPKVLFTLNINVTGVEGSKSDGIAPLSLVEGQKPVEAAASFVKAHGLPEVSAQEITLAIIQYAKQNGFGEQ